MSDTKNTSRSKITFVVTADLSVGFFFGLLSYLVNSGLEVEIVSAPGPQLEATRAEGATPHAVPMEREIDIRRDAVSLWRLWRLFRRTRPDLVIAGTPKAGLLGTLAARLAGVPHVVYMLHGLRLETTDGWRRKLLLFTERLACFFAHRVHCVSSSLRTRAIELGVVGSNKAVVVGPGTCTGVDTSRFRATCDTRFGALVLRRRLGITEDALVIGFVGRFTRDKGVPELYRAFVRNRERHSKLRLLLVGDFETGDPICEDIRQAMESDHAVTRTGFISDVSPYYHLMDICVLPTYREGFPGVPLEAQAAGVPIITTNATGAIESVLDSQTGFIVPVGDINALSAAIDNLLSDDSLRKRMGEAGCAWVNSTFRREIVWAAQLQVYKQLVSSAAMRASDLKTVEPGTSFSGKRYG